MLLDDGPRILLEPGVLGDEGGGGRSFGAVRCGGMGFKSL